MNANPKIMNAVDATNLKLSMDLLDFINDQLPVGNPDAPVDYITRRDVADYLSMMKDLPSDELPEGEESLLPELIELAKLVKNKNIEIITLR